jgi:superfamily I DNA/RNA helicase
MSANIRDDDFSLAAEDTVRVSTLHSSAGLDFAAVLVYLPSLSTVADYEQKAAEGLARNLVYVAISNAMDNLNVFVLKEQKQKVIKEMVGMMA